MKNKHRFLFAFTLVAIFLVGCGDKKESELQGEKDLVISGSAMKGVVKNARVAIYGFNSDEPITQTRTDQKGHYRLTVPAQLRGQPIIVSVRPDGSGSTMTCDLDLGCMDAVAFGDDMPLSADSGFELKAVVGDLVDNTVVNVTVLTDVATEYVLAQRAGVGSQQLAELITQADSQLVNRFGLAGELNSIAVVDITDAEALQQALAAGDMTAIEYAIIGPAIVDAVGRDHNRVDVDIVHSLNSFKSAYALEGLADISSNMSKTDMVDVWSSAVRLLDRVVEHHGAGIEALDDVYSRFMVNRDLVANEDRDRFHHGHSSPSAHLKPLDKVKAMVASIRDMELSLGDSSLTGGKSLETLAEEFKDQVEAASLASSDEAVRVAKAVARVGAAIVQADNARAEANPVDDWVTDDGITVHYRGDETHAAYQVSESIMVIHKGVIERVQVDLSASYGWSERELGSYSGNHSGRAVFNIAGVAQSDAVRLTIHDSSTLAARSRWHTDSSGNLDEITKGRFDLELKLSIAQLPESDPAAITLSGSLMLSFAGLEAELADMDTIEGVGLSLLSFGFGGKVHTNAGDGLGFAVNVVGNTSKVDFDEILQSPDADKEGVAQIANTKLNASLAVNADLAGILGLVQISLNVSRKKSEDYRSYFTIRYPGQQLRVAFRVKDGEIGHEVEITNQDGVMVKLRQTEKHGETVYNGNITYRGKQYAVISSGSMGIVIRYADRSIESI